MKGNPRVGLSEGGVWMIDRSGCGISDRGEIRLCCRLIEREGGREREMGGEEGEIFRARMYHTVLYDFRVNGVL